MDKNGVDKQIVDMFYNLIDKYDETGDTNSVVSQMKTFLQEKNIQQFQIDVDIDVYDSPGLDVYYISLAWVYNNKLHLIGSSLSRY